MRRLFWLDFPNASSSFLKAEGWTDGRCRPGSGPAVLATETLDGSRSGRPSRYKKGPHRGGLSQSRRYPRFRAECVNARACEKLRES